MKTANGINIAEKRKTPVQKIVKYVEHAISVMESDTSGEFSVDEILSAKHDLDNFKQFLKEEKEIINEAYEDGYWHNEVGDYNENYFELNFES